MAYEDITSNLKSTPFFFISTGIATGIYSAVLAGHEYYLFFRADVFLFALLLVGLWFWLSSVNPLWSRFNRYGQWILYFLFGQVLLQTSLDCNKKNYVFAKMVSVERSRFVKLRILEPLIDKEHNWRAMAEIMALVDSNLQTYTASGRLLVYFPKQQYHEKPTISYGDILLARSEIKTIKGALLPGAFDFKRAMLPQQVSHQIFLKQATWRKAGKQTEVFRYWAFRCSESIENKLMQLFPKRTAGIIASLLIGTRGGLEKADAEAFARTGTIHVLAVSGMHVTLICSTLSWLLSFGKVKSRKRQWRSAIIIVLIWIYTYITGLSPSIVRAALMFSIAEAGIAFLKTKGNLLNAVFTAMFLQLVYDPLVLFDVGFQLSYLAVLGIVFFNEPLKGIWRPYNRYLNLIWQSALISIVATLATLPVILLVFKTFPVWFVLANLLIVPLSSLLIYLGIAALIVYTVPILGNMVVKGCVFFTALMLNTNEWIGRLPGRITAINIAPGASFLLLLAIVFFGLYAGYYRFRLFYYGTLIFLMLIGMSSVYNYYSETTSKLLIFTKVKNRKVLVLKHRREVLCIGAKSSLDEIRKSLCYAYAERILFCETLQNTNLRWEGNSIDFRISGKSSICFGKNQISINEQTGSYITNEVEPQKRDTGKLEPGAFSILSEAP